MYFILPVETKCLLNSTDPSESTFSSYISTETEKQFPWLTNKFRSPVLSEKVSIKNKVGQRLFKEVDDILFFIWMSRCFVWKMEALKQRMQCCSTASRHIPTNYPCSLNNFLSISQSERDCSTKMLFWFHYKCKWNEELCSASRIHTAKNIKAQQCECEPGTLTNEIYSVRLTSQYVLQKAIFVSLHQHLLLGKHCQKAFVRTKGRRFMHKEVNPQTSILIHYSAILIRCWK